MKGSFRSHDENLWLRANSLDKRIFTRDFAPPVLAREKKRIHLAMQLALRAMQRREQITVIEIISNHQEIDIARCRVRAFRDRPEDERRLYLFGMRP